VRKRVIILLTLIVIAAAYAWLVILPNVKQHNEFLDCAKHAKDFSNQALNIAGDFPVHIVDTNPPICEQPSLCALTSIGGQCSFQDVNSIWLPF
jgi:ABC-type phosphate/phosphonate transport system permease subunit